MKMFTYVGFAFILLFGQQYQLAGAQFTPSCRAVNTARSCSQIPIAARCGDGIYYIFDSDNIRYPVYCDFSIDGGGWTMVASIHENNARYTGRCTTGDRWSNQDGNHYTQKHGGESWSDLKTFGTIRGATSDDYKNAAYFDLDAQDIMIWQVPNDTPMEQFSTGSYLQYYTTTNFLVNLGGNLRNLFKIHYPLVSSVYTRPADNGPSFPVTFAKGNAAEVVRHFGPTTHPYIEGGYIQFRTINFERSAYAMCPGVRVKSDHGNVEHNCLGSTADNGDANYCGDLAGFAWNQYGTGVGYNADSTLIHTSFLIFYR